MILSTSSAKVIIVSFAFTSFASCKKFETQKNSLQGISLEESNIRSEIVSIDEVDTLKLIPSTNIPKGVLITAVPFSNDFTFGGNFSTVKNLALKIDHINKSEGLSGLDGYTQQIDLLVFFQPDSPKQDNIDFKLKLLKELNEINSSAATYVKFVVESSLGPWQQDWGEFVSFQKKGSSNSSYGILATSLASIESEGIKNLSNLLDIPLFEIRAETEDSEGNGNQGGNIEITPANELYYGKNMENKKLEKLLQKNHKYSIKIHTNWLDVGHVDEIVSFIPSKTKSCSYEMILSSPLIGLFEFYNSTDAALGAYLNSKGPINFSVSDYRLAFESLKLNGLGIEVVKKNILPRYEKKADIWPLDEEYYFRFKNGQLSEEEKNKPEWDEKTTNVWRKSGFEAAAAFIELNLVYQNFIDRNSIKFGLNDSCNETYTELPHLFTVSNGEPLAHSFLPNPTNLLLLRNHVVVPAQPLKSFSDYISRKLGSHLGSTSNVHFVDTTLYHEGGGEIHCATNVIRELDMKYSIEK